MGIAKKLLLFFAIIALQLIVQADILTFERPKSKNLKTWIKNPFNKVSINEEFNGEKNFQINECTMFKVR